MTVGPKISEDAGGCGDGGIDISTDTEREPVEVRLVEVMVGLEISEDGGRDEDEIGGSPNCA